MEYFFSLYIFVLSCSYCHYNEFSVDSSSAFRNLNSVVCLALQLHGNVAFQCTIYNFANRLASVCWNCLIGEAVENWNEFLLKNFWT